MRKSTSNIGSTALSANVNQASGIELAQQKRTESHRIATPVDNSELDRLIRTLAIQIHAIQNALWPAAAAVEVSLSEVNCPPVIREMLQQIGRSVEESMTISSQMGECFSRYETERKSLSFDFDEK